MMIKSFSFILLVVCLTGCLRTRADLKKEASEPITVVENPDVKAVKSENMTPQEEQAAAVEKLKVDEVQDQMRELIGRLEVLEKDKEVAQFGSTEKQAKELETAKKMEERLLLYEQAISRLEQEVVTLKKQVVDLTTAKVKKSSNVKKGPYELGTQFLKQKKWKEAIYQYKKYLDKYPKGRRVAESTYYIGVSFQALGLKNEASHFYKEVVERFPKNKIASKAKVQLKKLK